jgi:hypothetical protein
MRGFDAEKDWSTVASPLRHLLDHDNDRGDLTPQQAAELAPALQQALKEIGRDADPGNFLWHYDRRAGAELVSLLQVCAQEGVAVEFR